MFERTLARAFRAEFGDVFDLEQRDFLDSQSELGADLNQRCVLFRIAMVVDNAQEVGDRFSGLCGILVLSVVVQNAPKSKPKPHTILRIMYIMLNKVCE